jgi:hypothetical protein
MGRNFIFNQNTLAYSADAFTEIRFSVAPPSEVVCDNQPHCTIIIRYYLDLYYKPLYWDVLHISL